jgi:hypothetical protein
MLISQQFLLILGKPYRKIIFMIAAERFYLYVYRFWYIDIIIDHLFFSSK